MAIEVEAFTEGGATRRTMVAVRAESTKSNATEAPAVLARPLCLESTLMLMSSHVDRPDDERRPKEERNPQSTKP
jgi:hypothetical protein